MATAIISTKYQMVIPKEVRNILHWKAGQRVSVIAKNGILHAIPQKSVEEMRGFLQGKMDVKKALKDLREKKDRY